MKPIIIACLTLLLAACSSQREYYVNNLYAEQTPEAWNYDYYRCARDNRSLSFSAYGRAASAGAYVDPEMTMACMRHLGWTKVVAR